MKKSMKKKLVLSKETMGTLLPQASGGITLACSPTWNCYTASPDFCQSGKYPC
ncbi:MAG TPA: hypothetical protein VGP73_19320 [Thermoanaerobaculia bacterium]